MTTELERISRLEGIAERTAATLESIERRLESLHAEMLAGDAVLHADIQALSAKIDSNTRNIIIVIAGVGTANFAVMAGAIITFILRF